MATIIDLMKYLERNGKNNLGGNISTRSRSPGGNKCQSEGPPASCPPESEKIQLSSEQLQLEERLFAAEKRLGVQSELNVDLSNELVDVWQKLELAEERLGEVEGALLRVARLLKE